MPGPGLARTRSRLRARTGVLLASSSIAGSLLGGLYPIRDELAEVHRRLTYSLDRFWKVNDEAIVVQR